MAILKPKILKWDSDFFKLKIGSLDLINSKKISKITGLNKFDCVYAFTKASDFLTQKILQKNNFYLVDIKATYQKEVNPKIPKAKIPKKFQIKFIEKSSKKLENLAYLAGHLSRFNLDPKFSKKNFQNLYKEWLKKCFKIGKILGILNNGELIAFVGFTLEKKNATLELIAVDQKFQGLGLAQILIYEMEKYLKKQKVLKFSVATQAGNLPANKAYQKYGFIIENIKLVYHWWKK